MKVIDLKEDKVLDRQALIKVKGSGFRAFVNSIDNALGKPRTVADVAKLVINHKTRPLRTFFKFANININLKV